MEQRFQHFAKHIWPRIADSRSPGVLLFVSSYYDYVRVRNFLKAQGASFSVNCEYTPGSDVLRARTRFAKQERKVLLYTERAHFYFRPAFRLAPFIVCVEGVQATNADVKFSHNAGEYTRWCFIACHNTQSFIKSL